jgi:DNA repair protein RadC
MKTYKTNLEVISLKKEKSDFVRCKVQSSKEAESCIRQFYFDDLEIYESFFILLLNRANNSIGFAKISQGGVAGTVVDVKIIAKYAVESLCSSVILAHNHPSGNLIPSEPDINITSKTKEALKFFDINVLDHIILASEGYYSFADEGKI